MQVRNTIRILNRNIGLARALLDREHNLISNMDIHMSIDKHYYDEMLYSKLPSELLPALSSSSNNSTNRTCNGVPVNNSLCLE